MTDGIGSSERVLNWLGFLCLALSLALLPAGVRVVQADEQPQALMSVDPLLMAAQAAPEEVAPVVVAPVVKAGEDGEYLQPGRAGTEVRDGVIVLNTRGYNYGPPPAGLDPAAIANEAKRP